jgi:fluoride exporter
VLVYLYVGIGGAIGSLFRYILSYLVVPVWNHFPIGTLLVNLLGSFILGWLVSRFLTLSLNPPLKTGITSGVIGSFTTFSTLSLEAMQLLLHARWGILFLYVLLSAFGGLGLTALGYFLGRGTSKEVGI